MKLIENVDITDAVIDSTNAAESVAAWLVGTSYSTGQTARSDTTHRIYESLVDANLGNDPTADDGTNWLNIGPTNSHAMFDEYNETQTSVTGSIDVVLTPGQRCSAAALLNLDAAMVTLTMTDSVDGLVFDQTYDLTSYENVNSYYDYFFELIIRKRDLFIAGLPLYSDPEIGITIDNGVATAKCGNVVIGRVIETGATLMGAEFGTLSSSRIETDVFGNTTIVPRTKRKSMNLTVSVARYKVDEVGRLLDARADLPTVFIGTEYFERLLVHGIPRNWRMLLGQYLKSTLTIEIEGLR